MGKKERRAYLEAVRDRYQQASKKAKAIILDEFCQVCGYNRKYAIRLLSRRKKGPRRRPGRKPVYHLPELLTALKRIWLATDQMCSKKPSRPAPGGLVAAIPLWLPFYENAYEKLSDEVTNKLLSVSAATIDRLLVPTRARTRLKGRVWINKARYFENVPLEVWNFHIGDYQVCQKWLKDHKGRTLSIDDLQHYQHIISVLAETIRLMSEIDHAMNRHGG